MSAETLLQTMLDGVPDSYQKTVGFPTYDILRAFALGAETLESAIENEAGKLNVENLSGEELTRFCAQYRAINRREATYAGGTVTVTGSGTVPAGALFESTGGVRFEATREVQILDSGEVPVRAVVAGAGGNVPESAVTGIPVTIPGISGVTNPAAMTGGYDAETDDELRYRYYLNVQEPPTSGNIAHYKQWALEVAGVGMAKVFPLAHGNWTVDVVIINNRHEPADEELIEAVQTHIDPDSTGLGDGRAPIGAHCYVESATARPITVHARLTLSSTGDAMTIKEEFQRILGEYLAGLPFTEQTPTIVSYARIGAALLDISGVLDYQNLTINDGTSNLELEEREVATAGEVTFDVA